MAAVISTLLTWWRTTSVACQIWESLSRRGHPILTAYYMYYTAGVGLPHPCLDFGYWISCGIWDCFQEYLLNTTENIIGEIIGLERTFLKTVLDFAVALDQFKLIVS